MARKMMGFKFSDTERGKAVRAAGICGLPVSTWARGVILAEAARVIEAKSIADLRRRVERERAAAGAP